MYDNEIFGNDDKFYFFRYAYLIFPSDDIVNTEVTEAAAKKLELRGHRLLLLNYRNPVNTVPRG